MTRENSFDCEQADFNKYINVFSLQDPKSCTKNTCMAIYEDTKLSSFDTKESTKNAPPLFLLN